MQVLPEGFALPPAPVLAVVAAGLVAVGVGFRRRRPAVTADHVVALVPWMVFGATLHVLYVVDAVGPPARAFLGTPAVYLTVAVVTGAAWLVVDATDRPVPPTISAAGVVVALVALGAAGGVGAARGSLRVLPSLLGFAAAVAVAAAAWVLLRRLVPGVARTEPVGVVALFGHALDGVSTAVGVDLLGFGERTPLSAAVLEFAASLPTASLLGAGWLFVLVKLGVAAAVVVLFREYVREDPVEANVLLGLVAAVGIGPGAHNLVLFAITA
jgi:uncharacterized membrane protein